MHDRGVTYDNEYIHGYDVVILFLDLCSANFRPGGEDKQGYYGVMEGSVV